MDMRRLVGQNLRRIRQKRGLTQEQFAEVSGFSQQYLSGLEGGHRNPTVVTVYELAVALGVSHMDLLRAGFASARLSPQIRGPARSVGRISCSAAGATAMVTPSTRFWLLPDAAVRSIVRARDAQGTR